MRRSSPPSQYLRPDSACTVFATFVPAFARLFLQRERAEAEVRQRARSLFLERELYATPGRNAVLLLASRYERAAVVFGDRAYDGRVDSGGWQGVVDAMTPPFRAGTGGARVLGGPRRARGAADEKGFAPDGRRRNVLSDRPLEPGEDR